MKTDVLIVLVDAQRITPSTSNKWDEDKGCEELWFDPVVETKKKRVLFMDNAHFELAVVRTPELRFIFDRGADWVGARRLILEFIKRRVPGTPLGPKWEPPAGSLLALKLSSCASVSKSDARQIEEMESKALLSQPLVQLSQSGSFHPHTHALLSLPLSVVIRQRPSLPLLSFFPLIRLSLTYPIGIIY